MPRSAKRHLTWLRMSVPQQWPVLHLSSYLCPAAKGRTKPYKTKAVQRVSPGEEPGVPIGRQIRGDFRSLIELQSQCQAMPTATDRSWGENPTSFSRASWLSLVGPRRSLWPWLSKAVSGTRLFSRRGSFSNSCHFFSISSLSLLCWSSVRGAPRPLRDPSPLGVSGVLPSVDSNHLRLSSERWARSRSRSSCLVGRSEVERDRVRMRCGELGVNGESST